jgi:ABC-type bacteriocin/lantibiotic exporter with double-glycine peptidase domain
MPSALRFPGAALLLGGALFLPGGCASQRPAADPPAAVSAPAAGARIIPGVPFLPQEEDTCGPSSLAMVLRFHGKDASTRALLEETRTAGLRGTLITDLAAAARRRGLPAGVTSLDMPELRRRIAAGEPVILLVDRGAWVWSRPHYLVAFGVTAEGVVAHSGRTESVVLPYGELDAQWARMGRLAIVVPAGGGEK